MTGSNTKVKRSGSEEEEMMDRQSDLSDDEVSPDSNKKAGASTVSKRTLQNRKAQREFRKRREARVRELEERCRRYDQMGLEANSELQRVARGLKEENIALRGFIVRLGFGQSIPSILQSANNGGSQPMQAPPQSQMGAIEGSDNPFMSSTSFGHSAFGSGNNNGHFGGPNFFVDPTAQSNNGGGQHAQQPAFHMNMSSPPSKSTSTMTSATLAPTPTGSMLMGGNANKSSPSENNGTMNKQMSNNGEQGSSDAPLLSLSFNNQNQRQRSLSQRQQEAQTQMEYAQRITAQSFNALFPGGAGSGGTAMLNSMSNGGNNNNGTSSFPPFAVAKRSQQNAALLNPNPIPFSFNLSNGLDPANSQPTWWEQMGGSADGVELDDKAQAVANAQSAGAQQAQSPFDLSAFLQGGLTPNGGFQLGSIGGSQSGDPAGGASKGTPEAGRNNTADTDHMRMFIRLMEQKMAERDARTYASLGFQPPSQDPAHRAKQEADKTGDKNGPTITVAKPLTPSGVYSRLSQHPAFLSTNAQEMQELVDALDSSSSTSWNTGKDIETEDSKPQNAGEEGEQGGKKDDSKSPENTPHSRRSTNGSVQVEDGDFGKLFGLLDKKSGDSLLKTFSGHGNTNNSNGLGHPLSMAMT
jgi:hypothetical protein